MNNFKCSLCWICRPIASYQRSSNTSRSYLVYNIYSCHPVTTHDIWFIEIYSILSPWFSRRNACRGCCRPDTTAAGPVVASWRISWGPIAIWEIVSLSSIYRRQRTGSATWLFRSSTRVRSCHLRRPWSAWSRIGESTQKLSENLLVSYNGTRDVFCTNNRLECYVYTQTDDTCASSRGQIREWHHATSDHVLDAEVLVLFIYFFFFSKMNVIAHTVFIELHITIFLGGALLLIERIRYFSNLLTRIYNWETQVYISNVKSNIFNHFTIFLIILF